MAPEAWGSPPPSQDPCCSHGFPRLLCHPQLFPSPDFPILGPRLFFSRLLRCPLCFGKTQDGADMLCVTRPRLRPHAAWRVILSPSYSRAKRQGFWARSSSQPRPFSKLVSTSVSPSIMLEKQTVLPSPLCKTLRGEFLWHSSG